MTEDRKPWILILPDATVQKYHDEDRPLPFEATPHKIKLELEKRLPEVRIELAADPEAVRRMIGEAPILSPGISQVPVSEHVMALALALARGIPRAIRQPLKHEWRIFCGEELRSKTCGIIMPNNAASTPHYYEYFADLVAENYRRAQTGRPFISEVAEGRQETLSGLHL